MTRSILLEPPSLPSGSLDLLDTKETASFFTHILGILEEYLGVFVGKMAKLCFSQCQFLLKVEKAILSISQISKSLG